LKFLYFLAGWVTGAYGGERVHTGLIDPAVPLDIGMTMNTDGPNGQRDLTLTFDGSRFVAVWADERFSNQSDLYAQVISPVGRDPVWPTPRPLVTASANDRSPSIASLVPGSTLLAWQRTDSFDNTRLVFEVQVTSQSAGAPCNVDAECASGVCTQSLCVSLSTDGGLLAPGTLSVDSPLDGALLSQARPLVRGKATAGLVVSLSLDGQVSSSVMASALSDFELAPSAEVSEGAHTLTLSISNGVAVTRRVTIDTLAPEAPVVISPADGETVVTSLPSLSGTAADGRVDVFIDGAFIGSSVPDAQRRWRVAMLPEQALERGPHSMLVRVSDVAGNSAEVTISFRVGKLLSDPPLKVGGGCDAGSAGLGMWLLLGAALLHRGRLSSARR